MFVLDGVCMKLIFIGESVKTIDKLSEGELFSLYPVIPWKDVQILPNATHAIQIIHQGDGTILRTESCITPAASGRHESQAPPLGKVRALNIKQTKYK